MQADRDQFLGQLGRTMRIGPHPAYLTIFRVDGLARLQEWEDYFLSDNYPSNLRSFAMQRSLQMVRDGCYDELIPTEQIGDGLYVLEFFAADDDISNSDIENEFTQRKERHNEARLVMLLRRIGLLGPDPGGIAGWRLDSASDLESFIRAPVRMRNVNRREAGLYRKFGKEIP
ncbi:MAG TPA: hypothetical protein VET25_06800 [Aestuariivirgaceae bacterium]|nr:hypothetical protein [Aestuariivirgaceae bacterium]